MDPVLKLFPPAPWCEGALLIKAYLQDHLCPGPCNQVLSLHSSIVTNSPLLDVVVQGCGPLQRPLLSLGVSLSNQDLWWSLGKDPWITGFHRTAKRVFQENLPLTGNPTLKIYLLGWNRHCLIQEAATLCIGSKHTRQCQGHQPSPKEWPQGIDHLFWTTISNIREKTWFSVWSVMNANWNTINLDFRVWPDTGKWLFLVKNVCPENGSINRHPSALPLQGSRACDYLAPGWASSLHLYLPRVCQGVKDPFNVW